MRLSNIFLILCLFINVQSIAQEFSGHSSPEKVNLVYQKPSLYMEVSFSDPDQFMDAGQTALLLVNIKNSGPGKAYDVKATLSGQYPPELVIESTREIGIILPEENKTISFKHAQGISAISNPKIVVYSGGGQQESLDCY